MPARYRRSVSNRRMARPRRVIPIRISGVLLPSLPAAGGTIIGQDLLSGFGAEATDAGFTVLSSHVQLTPNVAGTLNDTLTIAIGRCRNGDFGTNVAGGLSPSTTNYRWHTWKGYAFNGTWTASGGNTLHLATRIRYRVGADFDGFGLFVTSGALGAATQLRVWSTTFVALP